MSKALVPYLCQVASESGTHLFILESGVARSSVEKGIQISIDFLCQLILRVTAISKALDVVASLVDEIMFVMGLYCAVAKGEEFNGI